MKKIIIFLIFISCFFGFFSIKNKSIDSYACVSSDNFFKTSNTLSDNIELTYLPEVVPDGNSNFSQAISISENVKYTYTFSNESDFDYYYFSPTFANYYSIIQSGKAYCISIYKKDQSYSNYLSDSDINSHKTFYIDEPVYLCIQACQASGSYSFTLNTDNTYNGLSYTSTFNYKSYYGQKIRNLTEETYFNVYLDDSLKNGFSKVANANMTTLYNDAINEIHKLGYIRFRQTDESIASIKIYYSEYNINGNLFDEKTYGETTFTPNRWKNKVNYSNIVYNSTKFSSFENSNNESKYYYNALYVVMHELLHSIGLDHTKSSDADYNERNVMYFEDRVYKQFGAFDIASYRKLWG